MLPLGDHEAGAAEARRCRRDAAVDGQPIVRLRGGPRRGHRGGSSCSMMAWTFRVAWAGETFPPTAVTATTSKSGFDRARHNAIASSMPGSTSRITFLAIASSYHEGARDFTAWYVRRGMYARPLAANAGGLAAMRTEADGAPAVRADAKIADKQLGPPRMTARTNPGSLSTFPAGHAAGVLAELLGPIRRRGRTSRIAKLLWLLGRDSAATQLGAMRTQSQAPQRVIELFPGGLALGAPPRPLAASVPNDRGIVGRRPSTSRAARAAPVFLWPTDRGDAPGPTRFGAGRIPDSPDRPDSPAPPAVAFYRASCPGRRHWLRCRSPGCLGPPWSPGPVFLRSSDSSAACRVRPIGLPRLACRRSGPRRTASGRPVALVGRLFASAAGWLLAGRSVTGLVARLARALRFFRLRAALVCRRM